MYDFFPLRLFSVFSPSSYFPVPCALQFCPAPSLLLAKGRMQADMLPPTHCFASCIFSHDNKNVWLKIKNDFQRSTVPLLTDRGLGFRKSNNKMTLFLSCHCRIPLQGHPKEDQAAEQTHLEILTNASINVNNVFLREMLHRLDGCLYLDNTVQLTTVIFFPAMLFATIEEFNPNQNVIQICTAVSLSFGRKPLLHLFCLVNQGFAKQG